MNNNINMPRYLSSTHQKHWVFTQAQLDQIYEAKQAALFSRMAALSNDPNLQRFSVTRSEEDSVVQYLSKNLVTACKHMHLHEKAISTALTYFKRFYLFNSVCEFDPVQMMFTSMFLSCKTEEINIRDVHNFCQNFRESDPEAIIALEFALLSGIKFHLYVFCPFKVLNAFVTNISSELLSDGEKQEYLEKAKDMVEACLISSVSLKFSPSEIAMACLYCVMGTSEKRQDVFAESFRQIQKEISDFTEKFEKIISEFQNYQAGIENMQALFKGALKKSGSLRHRLKKLSKTEENPTKTI